MIRLEAIESVTYDPQKQYSEENLNLAAMEGDRFLEILPLVPKNVHFHKVEEVIRSHGFFFNPVTDNSSEWAKYRNVAEVHSKRMPVDFPGIYIVALITTVFTEIPSSLGIGDKMY